MNVWRLMSNHLPEYYEEVIRWSRTNGVIAVGWGKVGDLNQLTFGNSEELAKIVARTYNNTSSNHANGSRSLWRFYHDMQIGDLVILNTNRRTLVMQVSGDYYFQADATSPYYKHRRKAQAVPIDPNLLWQRAGGVAKGQNIYSALLRCANQLTSDKL